MSPPGKPQLTSLIPADKIHRRLEQLADEIARASRRKEWVVIAVLKGSYVFLADLARLLAIRNIHLVVDFLGLSSYGANTSSSGTINIRQDISIPIKGKSILLIDDILDSGLTLQYATTLLKQKGARSIKTCVLLDKPSRRNVPINADYVGFTIEDTFVVGYGLDYNNHYRQLPYIAKASFPPSVDNPLPRGQRTARKIIKDSRHKSNQGTAI